MKTTVGKRLLSILLAVLMVAGVSAPGFSALAAEVDEGGGVIGIYDIEIFYEDGTLVPEHEEDGETEFIQHLTEGDKVQFTYQLIDCVLPDNAYVKWSSDTPTVCDVTEDGIVRALRLLGAYFSRQVGAELVTLDEYLKIAKSAE